MSTITIRLETADKLDAADEEAIYQDIDSVLQDLFMSMSILHGEIDIEIK